MMLKRSTLLILILPTLLYGQNDSTAIRYSNMITAEKMSKNLHVLASDEYEGRETGKKGQKMAAEYIANQFKAAGILPFKDQTYYQHYPLNIIMPSPAEIEINDKKYIGNKDYYNFPGLTEQIINANHVLFLGYGIEEVVYSDYIDADVDGKVIMIMSGEPFSSDSVSLISGKKKPSLWSTYHKVKAEKAKEKGALALLIVVDDVKKGIEDNKHRLETPSMKLEMEKTEMPIVYISREMANEILSEGSHMGKKQSIEKIKGKISKTGRPISINAKAGFSIKIKNIVQKTEAENVLGYVEGTDLKDELIVITAHYDHLGKEDSIVFNGADDDGSGTVAVIELADVFAKAKQQGKGPRRSILFMTVSGEEKGLLGSSYYTDHPEFPLKNTVCDLNIDMIGRVDEKHTGNPNYIYLIGSDKLSSQLHSISEKMNKTYTNLDLDYTFNDEKDKNRFYYRSDHYNFARKGIPVIFYFNGVHEDYHKETDEVEKIDFSKMEKITKLVFFTAWELASRSDRIVVDSHKK
jgi:hypothetical protein